MLTDHPFVISAVLHPEYFENIERYRPQADFLSLVRELVDPSWSVTPRGFWTHCNPPGGVTLEHGWKIHLSTAPATALETLRRTVPLLAHRGLPFKLCSDPLMLRLSLSKNWSRSQAGKFLTVYPPDTETFEQAIVELADATRDLTGPHVLTDRRYADSRVVYYRYGEHAGRSRPDMYGMTTRGYQAPDGSWVEDERTPYFRLPDWVADPFSNSALPEPPGDDGVLLHDRYRVTSALKFNAIGGIYGGRDLHAGEETVIIREARPCLGALADGSDSFALLEKEARILRLLTPTGLVPRFIDLFQEWEHLFLVQERLDAQSLWGYSMNFYFDADLTPADTLRRVRSTFLSILDGLEVVHRHGVVLRDLTKNNVMLTADDEVKFIDLEFAYETDRDEPPVQGWTAGYASPEQQRNELPTPADDHYALGALLLDVLTYGASGFQLNRPGILRMLRRTLDDLGLPAALYEMVEGLTTLDRDERWDLERARVVLEAAPAPRADVTLFPTGERLAVRPAPAPELAAELADTVGRIGEFLDESADFARDDRLWPASGQVFATHPAGFQYGAAGPAFFLLRSRGAVDPRVLDWIDRAATARPLAPGLYSGAAGIALLFLAAGREERGLQIFDASAGSELLHTAPGVYYGAAGWGLAALHLWRHAGEPRHLVLARETGEDLLRRAAEDEDGLSWPTERGTNLGFAEGQSGVATFLLYLHAATGEAPLLTAARRALDFEIAHRQDTDSGVAWYPRTDSAADEPKSPHLWFGSAGVGLAAVRLWLATGDAAYRHFAERCAYSTSKRFTNKLWQDFGLSGFGELLLDMHRFTGDDQYLNNCYYLAEALLDHRIPRSRGVGFPGEDLFRICCDYSSGSAGIGVFLHRLLHPGTPRLMMLDDLLPARRDVPDAGAAQAVTMGG